MRPACRAAVERGARACASHARMWLRACACACMVCTHDMCACECARACACVNARMRACVRARARACLRACARVRDLVRVGRSDRIEP